MITVKLPDGSKKQLKEGSTGADLASEISRSLLKSSVAVKVNDQILDLKTSLSDGDKVSLLTKIDQEALEVLRHSAAHLMADAILRLFPKAQLTIGPVVEDGFYYDIFLEEGKITPEDFKAIEKQMIRLASQSKPFERYRSEYSEANEFYQQYKRIDGGHNKFKQEIVEEIKDRGEELSFYKHGDFIDLCRGPHVPHTGWLKHVKLTKVSGAYWRADASREQLTRVYGTAFFDKNSLDEYLHLLEEAKKRDHRVLGTQLQLFTFDEDAPGFPFFQPKGTSLFNHLTEYMRKKFKKTGYVEVKTPLVLSEGLWHQSGHYSNYMENMFFTKLKKRDEENSEKIHDNVIEERPMALKPMNCPGHLVLYKARQYSYQDLPLRFAEMGLVHRRELSGVRHGLFRVQAFTQDDAHHFCTPDQIVSEIKILMGFFKTVYEDFGLPNFHMELSTRPEKSIGSDEIWQKAESALKEALDQEGVDYKINPGDGAFYGPKIDFHIQDALKRSWQCGTIQLDFSMPERFNLNYIGSDGQKHTPVMIHRACYGSLERFLGILIEHYAGAFPLWLAPVQVRILPVSTKFLEYGQEMKKKLEEKDLRVEIDSSDERIGYKVRQASMQKVPYQLIVGEKEVSEKQVNVRSRDKGVLGSLLLEDFMSLLEKEKFKI